MTYKGATDSTALRQRELTHAERSQQYVTDFYDGLIDGHDFIVQQLFEQASHSYTCEGYEGRLSRIPEPLADHIGIDLGRPEQAQVTASLAFNVSHNPDRKFRLDFLRLEPADSQSLLLSFEDEITKVSRDGVELCSFIGGTLMNETLQALVPYSKQQADDERVARAIFTLSPESWYSAEVRDAAIYLRATHKESARDSRKSMDLQVSHVHSCGKTVLLKTTAEETLSMASVGVGTSQSLILSAGRRITYDEVEQVDGKMIHVDKPRLPHAAALRDAVENLLEKSWAKNGSLGSPWAAKLS